MTKFQDALTNLQPIPLSSFFQKSDVLDFFKDQRDVFLNTLNGDFAFPKLQGGEWHKYRSLFRITIAYKEVSEFKKVSDFYNPCACKTKLNRCNYPFYPVFYVSTTAIGALTETIRELESKLEIGKDKLTYFLSEWKVESDDSLKSIAFLESSMPSTHPWKENQERFYKEVYSKLSQYSEDEWSNILNMIAKEFCKKDSNINNANEYYKLSAYLSHAMLYDEDCVDYLIYPSVEEKDEAMNIAFHPQILKGGLIKFKYAFRISSYIDINSCLIRDIEEIFKSDDGLNLILVIDDEEEKQKNRVGDWLRSISA